MKETLSRWLAAMELARGPFGHRAPTNCPKNHTHKIHLGSSPEAQNSNLHSPLQYLNFSTFDLVDVWHFLVVVWRCSEVDYFVGARFIKLAFYALFWS